MVTPMVPDSQLPGFGSALFREFDFALAADWSVRALWIAEAPTDAEIAFRKARQYWNSFTASL